MVGTAGWVFKLGKRMVWALAIALVIVAGTIFRQNIENASAAIGTDNLLANGVPPWMATCMSGLISAGSWLAAQMFGPFGFGFVAAAVLFSIPDVPAFRAWMKRRRKRSFTHDPELIGVRSDANRLVHMLMDVDDVRTLRDEFETILQRIEKSPSPAWREGAIAKNREEFVNACRATYRFRAEWGSYPGMDEQYFEQIAGAQKKLTDSISG